MEIPDAEHEHETERDGFLSYATEWHALSLGFADGFSTVVPAAKLKRALSSDKADREIDAEPWYYTGGFYFGVLVGAFVWAIGAASAVPVVSGLV